MKEIEKFTYKFGYCLTKEAEEERRRKISASHKGKALSEEHKKNIGKANSKPKRTNNDLNSVGRRSPDN